jgi:hypothetical protein
VNRRTLEYHVSTSLPSGHCDREWSNIQSCWVDRSQPGGTGPKNRNPLFRPKVRDDPARFETLFECQDASRNSALTDGLEVHREYRTLSMIARPMLLVPTGCPLVPNTWRLHKVQDRRVP